VVSDLTSGVAQLATARRVGRIDNYLGQFIEALKSRFYWTLLAEAVPVLGDTFLADVGLGLFATELALVARHYRSLIGTGLVAIVSSLLSLEGIGREVSEDIPVASA
jgi:hypothetical protein